MAPDFARIRAAEFSAFLENVQLLGTNGTPTAREQTFVTVDQLREYWTTNRIRQALNNPSYSTHHISVIHDNHIRVFSILVMIDRPDYINLLMPYDRFTDHRLPFDLNYSYTPEYWPSDKENFHRFCEAQWKFCVPNLEGQRLIGGAHFEEQRILPYTKVKALKSGNTATTYIIQIHDICNRIINVAQSNRSASRIFVLKVYRADGAKIRKYFENEVKAFRRLMPPSRRVPNLITFYGSWEHGNIYNVLLEYADQGTLLDFFHTVPPPTRAEDITQFWKRLFDIVQALVSIHEIPEDTDAPSNSIYDVIFKIADLGLSHFHKIVDDAEHTRAMDTFGTPMYSKLVSSIVDFTGADSEKVLQNAAGLELSKKITYNEAACWVVLGQTGLDDYHALRQTQIPEDIVAAGYGSCFHNGVDVNPAVKEMHTRLMQERRISDAFVEGVTPIVYMMLDPNPRTRFHVNHVFKMCKELVRKSEDPSFPHAFRIVPDSIISPAIHTGHTKFRATNKLPETKRDTPPQIPPEFSTPIQRSPVQYSPSSHSPIESLRGSSDFRQSSQRLFEHNMMSIDGISQDGLGISTERNAMSSPFRTEGASFRGRSQRSPASRVSFAGDHNAHIYYKEEDEEEEEYDDINGYQNAGYTTASSSQFMIEEGKLVPAGGAPTMEDSKGKIPSQALNNQRPKYDHISVDAALKWRKGTSSNTKSALDSHIGKLAGRDHVFLIDDSESMREYRDEAQRVFKALARIVETADPDGIDLYFTNSPTKAHHHKKWEKLIQIVEESSNIGDCDMKGALQNIFDDFTADFDAGAEKSRTNKRISRLNPFSSKVIAQSKKKKGLSVYVLTTGVWQKGPKPACGVEQPIQNVISRLYESKQLDMKVGIQFIQFGNDATGTFRLDYLDRLRDYHSDLLM
ncbi:hypothetical protein N0V90_000620 [Kalmusia sp. IMI 367209]|nr:hypothetical protein N0V90_000620 [Kalmusia sp. IMI 367209]